MASPDILATEGFLFPRDTSAEHALRAACVDETHGIDVLAIPPLLQISIRGAEVRSRLSKLGVTDWPKGELSVELVLEFIAILRELQQARVILKHQNEMTSKLVSWLERAVSNNSAVWLNF